MKNSRPDSLNILGIPYTITYHEHTSDVDPRGEETLWGYIDYNTQAMRIFDKGCKIEFIWKTILHEVLHGIGDGLKLEILNTDDDKNHNELDALARALTDFLFRNDLLKIGEQAVINTCPQPRPDDCYKTKK